jgi:hypothetical protein
MPRTFIIREIPSSERSLSQGVAAALAVVVAAGLLVAARAKEIDKHGILLEALHIAPDLYGSLVAGPALLFVLLWTVLLRPSQTSSVTVNEAKVVVYPLGVQLSTSSRKPIFLMRDDIVDCIVNEVILAHKVISIILFRVRLGSSSTNNTKLVLAFPGINDMTYRDCLQIRNDIMEELR